jgi:DNA-binding response OmpR family regulator
MLAAARQGWPVKPSWLLVVDDDPRFGPMLEMACGRDDCRVEWKPNVAGSLKAIDDIPDEPPLAIILDLFMPEADGIDMMRELAGRRSRTPLIIISGQDPNYLSVAQEFAKVWRLPVLCTLRKPIDTNRLQACLAPLHAPPGSA